MEKYIINKLNYPMKYFIIMLLSAISFSACDDDDNQSVVNFDEPKMIVGPESGTINIIVRSNSAWKIQTKTDWLSFNIIEGAQGASIIASYKKNESKTDIRETNIIVETKDGQSSSSLTFKQMPIDPVIMFEDEIFAESEGGSYTAKLLMNIPNKDNGEFSFTVNYAVEDGVEWIKDIKLDNNILKFNIDNNLSPENRFAVITVNYIDDFGRVAEAYLKVTQYLNRDPALAILKEFEYVKSLAVGTVTENIYVQGIIIADGKTANFPKNRYTIQDVATNKAIVFDSGANLDITRGDNVKLWLIGTENTAVTEGNFTYNVFTSVGESSILEKNKNAVLNIPEIYIKDLTDDMLFSLVTLKDTEIAIPFGGYSNYNDWYVTGAGMYSALMNNYPTCIRDINGSNIYMLTNFEVPYLRDNLPQGSGYLTGLIVSAYNSNMGDIGTYSIRPLNKQDIDLAESRAAGFSEILVEWNCQKPVNFTEGMIFIPPTTGIPTAILSKSNATKFVSKYNAEGDIYFVDDYRAGKTVSAASYNAANWGTDVWWIIKNVSTKGISAPLSLQIETNSNPEHGPQNFAIEWSLDNTNWNSVQNGEYKCHGQTVSAKRYLTYIPGFKVYDFRLPDELLNKDNIYLRLRCTSTESVNKYETAQVQVIQTSSTNRIAHLSIKYNK